MNKLFFGLFLGLFFVACQNTPKIEPETAATTPAGPVMATPDDIKKADEIVSTGLSRMLDLRKQIDELPTQVRKEKEAEIEGFYATLEGMIAKQTKMMNDLKAAIVTPNDKMGKIQPTEDANNPEPLTVALLKDYTESVGRYSKEAVSIQEAVSKMGSK